MTRYTVVKTYCDHEDHGQEEEPGLTYRHGLSVDGGRWEWAEVDLCEPHAIVLREVAAGLRVLGRPFEPPLSARSSRRTDGLGTGKDNTKAEVLTCPECGRGFAATQGLGIHRSRMHGVSGTRRKVDP